MDNSMDVRFMAVLNAEEAAFQERFMSMTPKAVYESSYKIGFYRAYFDMLSSDYLDAHRSGEQIKSWLLSFERPVGFLYGQWLGCDGSFSDNWDDMLDWVNDLRQEHERESAQEAAVTLADKIKEAEAQRDSAAAMTRYQIEFYTPNNDEDKCRDFICADSRVEAINAFEKKHGTDCAITMCEPVEVPAHYKQYDEAVEVSGR